MPNENIEKKRGGFHSTGPPGVRLAVGRVSIGHDMKTICKEYGQRYGQRLGQRFAQRHPSRESVTYRFPRLTAIAMSLRTRL